MRNLVEEFARYSDKVGSCKEFVRSIQRYSIELKAVRILLGEWQR